MIYFNVLRGLDFTGKIAFKNLKKEASMSYKTMTYCPNVGILWRKNFLKDEGDIPYCSQCASFRFPVFNTAISSILFNENHDKILLIKQYDIAEHILLAGYMSQEENAILLSDYFDHSFGRDYALLVYLITYRF